MRYSAFISYSHETDSARARHLRHALHSFAKPWNSVRALRVFLDDAALSADPGLWSTVERALGDSEFLVLLASPQSAHSVWVDKEITWWRQESRARNLLLVVTGGELHWDHRARDFDSQRTTCLPPAVYGLFGEEPRWVDLRWMNEDHTGDLRDPQFRKCVADLAAPLHGRPKDELIGEDITQRRRFQHFRQAMLAGITALAILASVTAVFAFIQRNTAQHQARIATARQLAATALSLGGNDLEVASLIALQAYKVEKTPETLSALYKLTTQSPHLVRFVRSDSRVTALAITASPRYVAAGSKNGSVTIWTQDGASRVDHVSVSKRVTSLVFSDDNKLLAIGANSGEISILDLRSHKRLRLSSGSSKISNLKFRPSSHVLASASEDGTLRMYKAFSKDPVSQTKDHPGVINMSFWDEGSKLMVIRAFGAASYDSKLRLLKSFPEPIYPADAAVTATSPTGHCFGYGKYNEFSFWSVSDFAKGNMSSHCGAQPALPNREMTSLAISDNYKVAVGTSQGITVAAAQNDSSLGGDRKNPAKTILETLPGVREPSVLTFSPGEGDRLASAHGNTVALWNMHSGGPTMHRYGTKVVDGEEAVSQPALTTSPDGQVAWSQDTDSLKFPYSINVHSPTIEAKGVERDSFYYDLAFSKSGEYVYAISSNNTVDAWVKSSGPARRTAARKAPPKPGAVLPRTPVIARRGGGVTLNRVGTYKVPQRPDTGLNGIATREDGRVVVLRSDGATFIFDPTTAQSVPPSVEGRGVYDYQLDHQAALSADGTLEAMESEKTVTVSKDSHVSLLALPSRRIMRRIELGGSLRSMSVSDRSHSLFTVIDGGVLQDWDTQTGKLRWRSDGAGEVSIVSAPNSQWVATLSGDGTVWLWDSRTGDRLAGTVLPVPAASRSTGSGTGWQSSIAFSADGKYLWTITEGGEVLSWDTSIDAWIKELCGRVGRRLTKAERARYLTSLSRKYVACG